MTYKERILKFYDDVKALDMKFPGARITKETEYSKGMVSKYLNKELDPSEDFLDKFYEKFSESLKKVSHEIEETPPANNNSQLSQKIIFNLSESNRQQSEANNKQADANKIQAEANLRQIKQNETLISIIKTTVHVDQQTLQESVAMILGLKEYLIEIGSQVSKSSQKDVAKALNSKVKQAMSKVVKKGTHSEEHR